MTTDYQGNSRKSKEVQPIPPDKKIERVVVSEVIIKKKGPLRKFRDLFIEADLRTVAHHITTMVLIPAAKDMLFDSLSKGGERLFYGEAASRRRSVGMGPRVTYNNPINRGFDPRDPRLAPPQRPGAGTSRHGRDDFIISTKEEADLVLERMNDVVDQYEIISLADLNDMLGQATSHTDYKWGWSNLRGASVRQIREGYLLDLPPLEPIQ